MSASGNNAEPIAAKPSDPYIDHSVYPDLADPPEQLLSDEAKADYLHRICCAWDFGIHPDAQTFQLFSGWRDIFDAFPVVTSPAYHALRSWFGWAAVSWPTNVLAPVPRWLHLDRLEGRLADPCENSI